MTATEFSALADAWALDVKNKAVELFKEGCHVDQCLKLAIQIYDSKVLAKRQQQSGIIGAAALPKLN